MAEHPICISIILPVYNSAATLEKSLDSALGQTLRELEVIAVDDGSADESLRLLKQRAAADPRLRVIAFPENRGTLIARSEAVRAAQGEYLLFLDPDDTFRPEAAAELYKAAAEKRYDVVAFGCDEFVPCPDGSLQQVWNWITPPGGEVSGPGAVLRDLLVDRGHYWNLCLKLIRTEICRSALGDLEPCYCIMDEDFYFYVLIACRADSLLKLEKNYYNYFTAAGVTAQSSFPLERFRRIGTMLDALERIEACLKKRGDWQRDPDIRASFADIERDQLQILWERWLNHLCPEDRPAGAAWIFRHAVDRGRLVLALPEIVFQQEEKFAAMFPPHGPLGEHPCDPASAVAVRPTEKFDPLDRSAVAARLTYWKEWQVRHPSSAVLYLHVPGEEAALFFDRIALAHLGVGFVLKEPLRFGEAPVSAIRRARAFCRLADRVIAAGSEEQHCFDLACTPGADPLNRMLDRMLAAPGDDGDELANPEFLKFMKAGYRLMNRFLPAGSSRRRTVKNWAKRVARLLKRRK